MTRFLLYLLLPVPLASALLLAWALLAEGPPTGQTLRAILGTIVLGYVYAGVQSVVFALLMTTARRRGSALTCGLLAAALGALAGTSVALLTGIQLPLTAALGAASGALTAALTEVFAVAPDDPHSGWRRRRLTRRRAAVRRDERTR